MDEFSGYICVVRSRRWISLVVMVAYAWVLLGPIVPYLAFRLRQQQLTERYCVNQDRPALHCNGSCVLKKKLQGRTHSLAAAADQPQSPPLISYVPVYLEPEASPALGLYAGTRALVPQTTLPGPGRLPLPPSPPPEA
jgi:hypothetical protein